MIHITSFPNQRAVAFTGLLTLLATLHCIAASSDEGLGRRVVEVLVRSSYEPSSVGVAFADVERDSALFLHNAETMFIPASVAKLVTGAVALEHLGPAYQYRTRVFAQGEFDSDNGTLDGNLYIVGGGDPGLFAERIWLLVKQLHHLGLRTVGKDIVLDDSFHDSVSQGPGFGSEVSSRAYQAPVGALSASFNCVGVHVRPGSRPGSPLHVDLLPSPNDVKIVNTAKTVAPGKSSKLEVKTEPDNGTTKVIVFGGMAVDAKPRYVYRKVWHARENFGQVLEAQFGKQRMRIKGRVRHGRIPQDLLTQEPFLLFESQPLSEFIRHMFKYSSNFAAEMVYKSVSAELDSGPGSWKRTSEIIAKWWGEQGLPSQPEIRNGSGMGKANRLSASQVVGLLGHVWKHKEYYPDYLSALSIAGVDGTLGTRFKESALRGIVRAKTGTLNDLGVSTLAGYVLLPERTLAFAILMNSGTVSQMSHWGAQQRILEIVTQAISERRAVDPEDRKEE